MADYSGLGYNPNLLSNDSILLNNQNFFTSYGFNQNFQRSLINTVQLVGSAVTDAKIENSKLIPLRVIPEGKKEMRYEDFLRGQRSSM